MENVEHEHDRKRCFHKQVISATERHLKEIQLWIIFQHWFIFNSNTLAKALFQTQKPKENLEKKKGGVGRNEFLQLPSSHQKT